MSVADDYNEKRDFGRVGVKCDMTFQIGGDGEIYTGIAHNLSATGMLVTTDEEVPEGSVLDVCITAEEPMVPPLEASVEVIRTERLESGDFQLGLTIKELKS